MVDTAHAEGWQANREGCAISSNPSAAASAHDRVADMLNRAWQQGWLRAELARELHDQHDVLHRHLRILGGACRGWRQ